MSTIFVLVSEGDEVTQAMSAHHLISDAASQRERYIDEQYNRPEAPQFEISNRYGDEPATSVDISVNDEIVETLSIQAVELS